MIELQETTREGRQVQGEEVLRLLGGLRKRVDEHMQHLSLGDALQEIVDVLAMVSLRDATCASLHLR